jgi:hypothetical protein
MPHAAEKIATFGPSRRNSPHDPSTKRPVELRHPTSVGPRSTIVLVLGPAGE